GFSDGLFWNIAGSTITDQNQTAPDGSMEASALTNAGTDWLVAPIMTAGDFPSGTYTGCCSVKWLGTGSQNYRIGILGGASDTKTATASWGRFSKTVTLGAGALPSIRSPDATSVANLAICD